MSTRFVVRPDVFTSMERDLAAAAPREAAGFLFFRAGRTATGVRALVQDWWFMAEEDVEVSASDRFRLTGKALSAAIGRAIESSCGLAFVHSHPHPRHPPSLSWIDRETSSAWSRTLLPALGQPFASLVWTPQGVAGTLFVDDASRDVDSFDVVGSGLLTRKMVSEFAPQSIVIDERDDRQVRALGNDVNHTLRTLSVAVIGAGGTGSSVADLLGRLGVARILLVDPDIVDTSSNLRRIVGARPADLASRDKKVNVLGRYLRDVAPDVEVVVVDDDVRFEDVGRQLLDCDVVVSTTDTHSSRATINQLAVQYWLPTVDVGVRIGTDRAGRLSGMPAEVRILMPDNGCLWCRDVLSAENIYAENLPADERSRLVREGYVTGGRWDPAPSLSSLNQFGASLAVLAATRLLTPAAIVSDGFIIDGWEVYAQVITAPVDRDCVCATWRGAADDQPVAFMPRP